MKKIKILVLENIKSLDDDMSQYIRSLDKNIYEIDLFTNLLNSDSDEIKKRVFEADEICLKSLFFNRDQMSNVIDLIFECAKVKKTKYKVSVMFARNNKFLDFLNIDLSDVELKMKIIDSLIRIDLNEILAMEVNSNGKPSYFKTDIFKFKLQPIYFYMPFLKFIHDWNIQDKSLYNIEHSKVTYIKTKNNWLNSLSSSDKKTLNIILNEHKAKLNYDLEDEDSISKYCSSDKEAKELIKEKKDSLKLLNKIIS